MMDLSTFSGRLSNTMHRTAALFLALASLARTALAQDVTGNLTGRYVTTSGFAITDVRITIAGPTLQGARVVYTDGRGYFRILGLPVGSYTVHAARIGFRELVVEEVRIQLGKTVTLGEIRLESQTVELPAVVVQASAVMIDPVSTTLGANLAAGTIEALPIDRAYRSMIAFLPHANASYYGDAVNIGGSTGLENLYFVDGVNVTTPLRATTGTNLPHNFVKEVEVKQGGYEAEYGRALGGVVNAITHSGTNEWEGATFAYFTNGALSAKDKPGLLDLPERGFSTYDIGVRLSGPISRDRLWFSAAYNPTFEKRDVQALNQGFLQERRTEHRFAAKVTWRASENTDIEASLIGDPTTHHHVAPPLQQVTVQQLANPDPFSWLTEEGGIAVSLRGRHTLGRRLTLELSVARSWSDENLRGSTEIAKSEPYFHDLLTATSSGGVHWREDVAGVRTSANLRSTLLLGSHTVRIGASYEMNRVDFSRFTNSIGIIIKQADADFLVDTHANELKARRNRAPTVYVQDSWRLTSRLTVNAGLRWDGQYLLGAGDSVAQAFTKQWQPRVGIVLQLGDPGLQKLFGSYGRFYQQRPLLSTVLFLSGYTEALSFYSVDPREPGAEPDLVFEFSDLGRKVEDADGEHFDEFMIGYERAVDQKLKLVVRGIHRVLRASWGAGLDSVLNFVPGNPGKGDLSFLPKPKRQYTAVELTAEHGGRGPLYLLASYVLSRTYGNYTGLFSSDVQLATPGNNWTFSCEDQGPNSSGLLPNDRTHVMKVVGSYRFNFGLSVGTFFTWQSGTPLTEYGPSDCLGTLRRAFLVQRGSVGRTPSIWDLNMRFAYPLGPWDGLGVTSRLVLDVLHIGNPRQVTVVDQLRLLNDLTTNPTFGEPLVHQPPMSVRLGVEFAF